MPPLTGRVIAGRYNLQSPIGRGAMGVVWRARDQLLDRDVAIKEVVISALIGADERHNAYQRTLREARTAARLSHRGVVTIYDVVEEDSRPWIVMELVPSQSLDQVLTVEGRLPTARAGRIGQQLLSALAAAHAAGVLHRDVKPSNVLIAASRTGDGWEERAVLTDFGIAQFEGDPRLTQTGMVMGSPGFTAPERIRGGDATPGSDLWSLGATIYAAVEGRGPYEQRGGAITTMSAIINEDAPVAPHAGRLAPLIAALLRRDPSARPSASAAARMFAQVLPQLADTPAEPPPVAHPATIRSAYVPPPAEPAADSGNQPVEEPVPAEQAASAPEAEPEPVTDGRLDAVAKPEPEPITDGRLDAVVKPDAAAEPVAGPDQEDEPELAVVAAAGAAESAAEAVPAAEGEPAGEGKPAGAEQAGAKPAEPADGDDEPSGQAAPAEPGASGYQPTELSIPVARSGAAPPGQAQPTKPTKPTKPKAAPDQPTRPAPSFTAAKPADRVAPSFSAARPATPPAPRPSARPGAGSPGRGGAGQGGYPATGGAAPLSPPGGTYPAGGGYGPPGGQYQPPGGQYGGPSQSHSDLAGQYPPGSGGGRPARRPGGRGRRIAWIAAAAVAAAAIGVGAALALNDNPNTGTSSSDTVPDTPSGLQSVDALNNPTTAVPAGFQPVTVQASDAKSTAGFSLDLPAGWKQQRKDLATDFTGPGDLLLEVDLTPQPTTDMLQAATTLEHQRVTVDHAFPGYKRDTLKQVPVRNTEGAVWKFTWTPAGSPGLVADDILFRKQTSAGPQDYAIYIRSPQATFGKTSLPLFNKILRTFQTVPATTTQPPVTTSPSQSAS
jgi:hypothetical protein